MKTQLLGHSSEFLICLRWSLRKWISTKFPRDANAAAGLGTTLRTTTLDQWGALLKGCGEGVVIRLPSDKSAHTSMQDNRHSNVQLENSNQHNLSNGQYSNKSRVLKMCILFTSWILLFKFLMK